VGAGAGLWRVGEAELLGVLRLAQVVQARVDAARLMVVGELDVRGVGGGSGASGVAGADDGRVARSSGVVGTAAVLAECVGVDSRTSASWVRLAREVGWGAGRAGGLGRAGNAEEGETEPDGGAGLADGSGLAGGRHLEGGSGLAGGEGSELLGGEGSELLEGEGSELVGGLAGVGGSLTGRALTAGEVSLAHAQVITGMLHALPAGSAQADRLWAERFLVEQARALPPGHLRPLAARIAHHLDPDGVLAKERAVARGARVWVGPDRGSGVRFGGCVDSITGAQLATFLDAHSAPVPHVNELTGQAEPDRRCADERRADAFGLLVRTASGADPTHNGGLGTDLIITIPFAALQTHHTTQATHAEGSHKTFHKATKNQAAPQTTENPKSIPRSNPQTPTTTLPTRPANHPTPDPPHAPNHPAPDSPDQHPPSPQHPTPNLTSPNFT
ncbi:MAG: DUF222 domain-containing protein, partial [Angustibacter sp.]